MKTKIILPFIAKLALGQPITDLSLVDELYEICDREHGSCNSECPVYYINGNKIVPDGYNGCACFKSGITMLAFIRKAAKP